MSVPIFEHVTLVASNDTSNGGVLTVECLSQPINLNEAECITLQLIIESIWGAGSPVPKLTVAPEFSADGVNFGTLVSGPTGFVGEDDAGTKLNSGEVCGGFVRLRATFQMGGTGTTGPGAVTFSVWMSHGDDGV